MAQKLNWRGPLHSPTNRRTPKAKGKTTKQTNPKKPQTKHTTNQTKTTKQREESERQASSASSIARRRWYHCIITGIGTAEKQTNTNQRTNIINIAIPGLWLKQHNYCRGTSKCLQSCWGLEKLVLVSWKCHAVAWDYGFRKFATQQLLCL